MGERWRTTALGTLELVDEETGEVLAVQKQKEQPPGSAPVVRTGGPGRGKAALRAGQTHHWVIDGRGRRLWVPVGTNPDDLPKLIYPYCETTADLILEKVSEGATINEVGKLEGFPPSHIIHKWLRKYPEFKAQMKEARLARAEFFADQVKTVADQVTEKTSKASRVKMDASMWLAEVNDRSTYGKSTKLTGDSDSPIGFIIQTGVPESIEPPAIPAEGRRIGEES